MGLHHLGLHTARDHLIHKLANGPSILGSLTLIAPCDHPSILHESVHRDRSFTSIFCCSFHASDELLDAHSHVRMEGSLRFSLSITRHAIPLSNDPFPSPKVRTDRTLTVFTTGPLAVSLPARHCSSSRCVFSRPTETAGRYPSSPTVGPG